MPNERVKVQHFLFRPPPPTDGLDSNKIIQDCFTNINIIYFRGHQKDDFLRKTLSQIWNHESISLWFQTLLNLPAWIICLETIKIHILIILWSINELQIIFYLNKKFKMDYELYFIQLKKFIVKLLFFILNF